MTGDGLALGAVSVALGGRLVVDGLSAAFARGTLTAIVGPNGAGKTSLLRAIVGLVPSRGTIAFDRQDLSGLGPRERARRLAYLPQGHEAHWPLPARDIVALGRLPHGGGESARMSEADAAAITAAMQAADCLAFADRPVTTLSGGERARVALARVLAVGAPLILADEPTAALDPRHQLDVMRILRGAAEAGSVVLAVTHDLGLAARFADRVLVLQNGRLAAAGDPEEALGPGVLRTVFGVEAFRAESDGRPVLVPWN